MTTTIFKKTESEACMACDSRTSWVDDYTAYIVKWFDSSKYKKTINIDGVMYGFAGANFLFKFFLESYTNKEESEQNLDVVVMLAKQNKAQFMLMRYDGEDLKIYAYSPPNALHKIPEIFKISSDLPIDTDCYAIGSGKYSDMYKKHCDSKNIQTPIHQIISSNRDALNKKKYKILVKKVAEGHKLKTEEAVYLSEACKSKGGDLFTGGNVNMCKVATKQDISNQISIMNEMDKQAKAAGAVCSSPINAAIEKEHLEALGHDAVSKNRVVMNERMSKLLDKMQTQFETSI